MSRAKIGVCEFCLPSEGTMAVRMAHEAGFEGMQLGDLGGVNKRYPFSDPYVQDLYMEAGTKYSIEYQAMHLQSLFNSRMMLENPGSDKAATAREALKIGAEACRQMGIATMMVTGTMLASKEQFDNLAANLTYGVKVAEDNGIQLAMETDLTPAQFHELRAKVGDGLKLCFDMMNPTVYGIGEPCKLIDEYGLDIIDHFHTKDCVENANGYFTRYTTPFRLIGEGRSGFDGCVKVLNDNQYSGWVISETFYFSPDFAGRSYMELMQKDVETLRKAFA